jgi:thiol-disulfide isomerase/thioredoxin
MHAKRLSVRGDTSRMLFSKSRLLSARCCVFGLVMASARAFAAPADDTGQVKVGQSLPDASMAGLNGPPRTLSSFRGHPLIINVWASWCTPCRAEAASLERFAWSEAGKP